MKYWKVLGDFRIRERERVGLEWGVAPIVLNVYQNPHGFNISWCCINNLEP